uniref:IraD/Gp25-like domain-containing protein n=1 Tax=candidate division WOR-3 bacterium TaxID=2052148 RepID=A0A7C6EBT5_UNCW3
MKYYLGTDLALDSNGDLALDQGDIALVSGMDCLIANLTDRILCDKGELILHPEFGAGLAAKVSQPITSEKLNSLIIELRHELLQDPRVEQVISLEDTQIDRYLYIRATIETIDHQIIQNLIFPFELERL